MKIKLSINIDIDINNQKCKGLIVVQSVMNIITL